MKISNLVNNPETVNKANTNRIQMPKNQPDIKSGLGIDALIKVYGEKQLKKIGAIECKSCAERTYVDVSDDIGVSFKSPGKISPEASAAVVMSHELEHVSREQDKAEAEDREVVSQSVALHFSICAECGKAYVAGGETRTSTQIKKQYYVPEDFTKGLYLDQEL